MTEKPEVYRHNGACGVGGDCPHPDHERKWPGDMFGDDADYPSEPLLSASEVKVLTETATRVAYALGRKDAGEEIAEGIEAVRDSVGLFPIENLDDLLTSHQAWTNAAQIARDLTSQPSQDASDATSGVPESSEVSSESQAVSNRLP